MHRSLLFLLILFPAMSLAQTVTATSNAVELNFGFPELQVRDNLTFIDENGNNYIDRGEACVISFTVENVGKYPAKGITVTPEELNNIGGLRLSPKVRVGDIPPGANRTVQVGLAAEDDLEEGTASLIFRIYEDGVYKNLSVVYAVGTAQPAEPQTGQED
jgi:hypothetical protein